MAATQVLLYAYLKHDVIEQQGKPQYKAALTPAQPRKSAMHAAINMHPSLT